MPDMWENQLKRQLELLNESEPADRRAQPRSETAFSRIEDATYAILREHEKKTA